MSQLIVSLRKSVPLLMTLLLWGLTGLEAQASHFRYGTLSWEPTGNAGEVRFRLIASYRRTAYRGTAPDNLPQVGDVITESSTSLDFGDNAGTGGLRFVVIAFSISDNFIIGEALNPGTSNIGILHTYAGAGPFTAELRGCCRISALNNRPDSNFSLQTVVMPRGSNRSPITTLVPIISVPPSNAASFLIPAADPDGDNIRWRLSTEAEAGGGPHPLNLSVDPATGRVTWNNTGLNQQNFWTTQVIIEDLDANGQVKTKTPVDFFLKIGAGTGNPPTCTINPSTPLMATPGAAVSFVVTGTDPDAGDMVTLNTGGLPTGATMTPGLPLTGASGIASTFNWQPTAAQIGTFVVVFSATDNSGQQSLCSTRIAVSGGASADLLVTKNASANPTRAGSALKYSIAVTNAGATAANNVVVTDALPAAVTFQSLTATGLSCTAPAAGQPGTVTCTTASLNPGASATVEIEVNITCTLPDGAPLSNTVTASSATPDANPANNSATTTVTVNSPPPQIRLTLEGGKTAFDFGRVAAQRELNSNPPSETFTIENSGCAPLVLSLAIRRTGEDVASGRIANADDSTLFPVRLLNTDGTETAIALSPGAPPVQIPGGQSRRFRVQFNPLIPILAGQTTSLFANQVLPETINSELQLTPQGSAPLIIKLAGQIATPVKLTHPADSRLEPLVVFTLLGDEFTVECTTHDANLDLFQANYQFLDQNDRPVGVAARVELAQAIAARDLVRGQSFSIIQRFSGAARQPQIKKVQVTLIDREGSVTSAPALVNDNPPPLTTVSAASFTPAAVAGESIVAAFGSSLAAQTLAAPATPLPTTLGGATVRVRDGAGAERAAPLFFVAPGQINYQMPAGTMVGAATVTVWREGRAVARSGVQVAGAAPGLFAANANGQGAAAAVAIRASGEGEPQYEPVAQFDAAQQRFVTRPLTFGPSSEQLYLALFGTGLRYRRSNAVVRIGGIETPALFAGAQGGFTGLDQINVLVPRALAGRGEVEVTVTVDGRTSNPVRVRFGGAVVAAAQNLTAAAQHAADSYVAHTTIHLPRLSLTALTQPPAASHTGGADKTKEK